MAQALVDNGADGSFRADNQQRPIDLALLEGASGHGGLSRIPRSDALVNPETVISELRVNTLKAPQNATTLEALEAIRAEALGRKGKLAEVEQGLRQVDSGRADEPG